MEKNNLISKKQISKFVTTASVLFLMSIIFGYWLSIKNAQEVESALQQTLAQFANIKNLNAFLIFLFIFLNNAIKGFFVVLTGIFFGIVPLFFVFLNGELIGFVLGISHLKGLGIGRVIVGIAPHGILEIPAIMLSAGYGLWLGYRFFLFILRREPFEIYFNFALKKYFTLILPMLFLAALIEAFITPAVLKYFEK